MDEEIRRKIGKRIKHVRIELSLKQTDLSNQLNCHRSNITHMEKGKNPPSADLLYLLNTVYKISTDWILSGKGSMFVTDVVHEEDVQQMLKHMSESEILKHEMLSHFFSEKGRYIKKKKNKNEGNK